MSFDNNSSQIQSSYSTNLLQPTLITTSEPYHKSLSGSILHSTPTNSPSEIFSYLRHGNFDAFRRSIDVYHKDIIQMKNEHGQTVLHVLTVHAYPYQWVRLVMMRGCDPCSQDADKYTAAHYAVERDDAEMLKALTTRFHSQVKIFPEEQLTAIHERSLEALTIKEKHGLSVFMLACHHESIKCINYLLELKINDVHLQDHFGDTCVHYAVARRNEILVEKLINQCNANVNSGDKTRPSILDIVQFNREQQKPFDKVKDDLIEQMLLSHNALNRCQIRRVINKRKVSMDNDEEVISDLACLTVGPSVSSQIETARNHARLALSLETRGDINGAQEYYKQAMNCIPNDILDWATYAFQAAILHLTRGEHSLALDLLRQALTVRKRYEKDTEEINKLQHAINNIEKHD